LSITYVVLELSKVLGLSLVALMLLSGAVVRPASALNPINPPPTFTLTGTPALSGATYAVIYNGNLWVSQYGQDTVDEYTAPFTANEAPAIVLSVTYPAQLTFDPSGNLWVGSFASNVYEFDAPITNSEAASATLGGLSEPTGVVLLQGNLWVFSLSSDVYEYAPEPSTNVASPPAAILTPLEPIEGAFDSSGNLWVALYNGGINEYASPVHSGEAVTATLNTPGGFEVSSLAFDGAGNLWIGTPRNSGIVAEFQAPLTNGEAATSMITIASSDSIWGVTIDQSGNLWVGDYWDNAVYEFSGLASPFVPTYNNQPPLPGVLPKHMTLNFGNAKPIIGNLVSAWGIGVDKSPYMIGICNNAANSTMTIRGFSQLSSGNNATEFLAVDWLSLNTSA
jgi:sugar lactone lactonase YvrE